MPLLPLSTPVFSILSGLVGEKAGLHFAAPDRDLFAEKVSSRAVEAGFESLLDYYYFLRYDAAGAVELDLLVESLVVGETYLFRELDQLEVLISDFVVPRLGSGRRPRIWSAACATGEEPHTIAMLLAARGILNDVDLIASDISGKALSRARAGHFTRRALRGPIPEYAERWVEQHADRVVVAPGLRATIDWRRINLVDGEAIAALGEVDVIVCRNVLIYFDEDTTRRVVSSMTSSLVSGGALFVGVSESLLRFGTSLECEEHRGVFVYRKLS